MTGKKIKPESGTKQKRTATSKYKKEIEALKKEVQEQKNNYLRAVAELENYKKFSQKEHLHYAETLKKSIFLNFIKIVDDFERALAHKNSAKDGFQEGIELIYKSMLKLLEQYNVKPFNSVNEPFDHSKHEAIGFTPNNDVEENTVLAEQQKGYLYNDEILRHSKVIVSTKNTEEKKEV